MIIPFDENLRKLSARLPKPLYAVGGSVRNYFIDGRLSSDIDLAGAIEAEDFKRAAIASGFSVVAEYKRTGTVVVECSDTKYEFTRFRKEKYAVGGKHLPMETEFTEDLSEDARRRDFRCNAVYYDISSERICDVLNGIKDIQNKVLDTVVEPSKVFANDGLRLMRLARFCGELNFTPTDEVLRAARENASNISDVSPERIYDELKKLLVSDIKYPFSDRKGHYDSLKILDETRVLDNIFPELALGRGMLQREDYHNYDVLEHTLKTVLYSPKEIRLAALLHDVGKPYEMNNTGKYYGHDKSGAEIALNILKRLKADKQTINQVVFLTAEHMRDISGSMSLVKLRSFFARYRRYIPLLIKLKQADYSAGKDDISESSIVSKWKKLWEITETDGTPKNEKELQISAGELMEIGFKRDKIGVERRRLFFLTVENPLINCKDKLLDIAKRDFLKFNSKDNGAFNEKS